MRSYARSLPRRLAFTALFVGLLGSLWGCSGGAGSAPPVSALGPAGANTAPLTGTAHTLGTVSQVVGSDAYTTLVKSDNPLVYYRLNEASGSTAVDSGANHQDGTYTGTVGLNRTGAIVNDPTSKSASFTNGYVQETATWSTSEVTAEAWVRPAKADLVSPAAPRLIDNGWSDSTGKGFMLWINGGKATFTTSWTTVQQNYPLVTNRLYHFVGTYSPATGTKLYVNGILVAHHENGITNYPNAGDSTTTYIGAMNAASPGPGYVAFLQGTMGEAAIYDHALAATSIVAHFRTGAAAASTATPAPAPSPTSVATTSPAPVVGSSSAYTTTVKGDNPLVYYRLNETSGSTAIDSGANHHDGTYTGSFGLNQPGTIVADPSSKSATFTKGYVQENVTWSTSEVTAEAWVRPAAFDLVSPAAPRLIDNGWADSTGKGFMLWINNGHATFTASWNYAQQSTPLVAGQLYHLVGTFSPTIGTTLYVNGLAVANHINGISSYPNVGDSTTTYIGAMNAASPGPGFVAFLQGTMGEAAVYDHALSPANVAAHYNAGANANVVPVPIPTTAPTPTPTNPPTPMPLGTPIAYNASTACIYGKLYSNDVLPAGEGEFGSNGLDRAWWSRYRGDGTSSAQLGNWVSGLATSTWGRTQYNTYFGDSADGISTATDDPFYVGADTTAPGSPNGLRIRAMPMPAHLVGNPQVQGQPYYSGALMTPVFMPYGFVVARVRTPKPAGGLSPAFWMLQGQAVKPSPNGGNLSDEWDIQEMFGNDIGDGMNQGELIWNSAPSGGYMQNWGGSYNTLPNGAGAASADYHDYGVLMNPGGAPINTLYNSAAPGATYGDPATGNTFMLDGQPVYGHTGGADINATATTPGYKEIMAMFQVSSGGWLGTPSTSNFPADYWMQWIRVYRPTGSNC